METSNEVDHWGRFLYQLYCVPWHKYICYEFSKLLLWPRGKWTQHSLTEDLLLNHN